MKTVSEKLTEALKQAQLTRVILYNELPEVEEKYRNARDEENALVTVYGAMVHQFSECIKACDFVDNTVMNGDEEEKDMLIQEYKSAPKESAYREQLRVLLKGAGMFDL